MLHGMSVVCKQEICRINAYHSRQIKFKGSCRYTDFFCGPLLQMDTSQWPQMPEQQRKRTVFVQKYLETGGSESEAAKVSGLSRRHTRQRIADHIRDYGTLAEAPHPQQPSKYTESVMHAALGYFKKCGPRFATPDLVTNLIEDGILQEPVNQQNFRQHFKEWLDSQGMTLVVGCKKMIFEITPAAAKKRLRFVEQHSALVDTQEKLGEMMIVDETTFEEGPHPKGKGT